MNEGEIQFERVDGRVRLDMSVADWEQLLFMLGVAAGAAEDKPAFWSFMRFINRLNQHNPRFTPYELPEEEAGPVQ